MQSKGRAPSIPTEPYSSATGRPELGSRRGKSRRGYST